MSKRELHPYRVRCTVTVTAQGGTTSQSRTTREQTLTIRAVNHTAALQKGERELFRRLAGRAAGEAS